MPTTDPRVDAYIAKSPAYAQPILKKLRALVHRADKGIEETIKWGAPAFVKSGVICTLVAFKKHVALWVHNGALVDDPAGLFEPPGDKKNMRAVHVAEGEKIDARGIAALLAQAVALDAEGVKRQVTRKGPVVVPPELKQGLARQSKARKFFESLTPSQQRAFVDWINDAKREATRERRLAETLELLRAGLRMDEKYR